MHVLQLQPLQNMLFHQVIKSLVPKVSSKLRICLKTGAKTPKAANHNTQLWDAAAEIICTMNDDCSCFSL